MPLRDGPSAAARIRHLEAKRGVLSRVPIVGLSADCQQSARLLSISSGMNEYLNKPLRGGELVSLLRTYVLPRMGRGRGEVAPPPRRGSGTASGIKNLESGEESEGTSEGTSESPSSSPSDRSESGDD